MPLPDSTNLGDMDYPFEGQPFVQVIGKAIDTSDLSYPFEAEPFTAASEAGLSGTITGTLSFPSADLTATGDLSGTTTFTLSNTGNMGQIANISGTMAATFTATGSFAGEEFVSMFSTKLGIISTFEENFSSKLGVNVYHENNFSTNMGVYSFDQIPVTDITNPLNIFEPTIVVDGVEIVSNPSTSSGISNLDETCLFVGIKNAGMTNCSLCDLEGFSMSITDEGGSWSIDSLCANLGTCWDQVSIYDLLGTITETGFTLNSSTAAYHYSGFFGNPNMHRPFRYIVAGTPLNSLVSNQSVDEAPTESWMTASSAAAAIAAIAGTNIQWHVKDTPVSNFRLEEGGTGLESLKSLASRAGGKLRWNGDNSWKVVYPDYYEGIWEVPSCNLILPGGISKSCYCSVDARPIIAGSVPPRFDAGVTSLPGNDPSGAHPQVQLLTKFSKRLTEDDPPLIFDLPYDYENVYAQILVNVGQSTSGNNLISLHNYMTTNPQQYFEYDASGFGIQYIFNSNIGGVIQPQVRVDYRCLPVESAGNAAIEAGNFTFSLYYTRRTLTPPAQNTAKDNELLGLTQDNYRFVKDCDFTIQCLFFGSIPLPGMLARATVPNVQVYVPDCLGGYTTVNLGDIEAEGIIESVSFSFPGYLTVNCSTYTKLSFYNTSRIDYSP